MSKFPGFPPESQTWNFPVVLNGHVHSLSGAEFKVLWYTLRHTWGWQKGRDAISLSQFQNGIRRKDGTNLDKGTGLSRQAIVGALQSLEKKGFISIQTKGKRGGKTNYYTPKIEPVKKVDCSPVKKIDCFNPNQSKELTGTSLKIRPEPVKKLDTQSLTQSLSNNIYSTEAEAIYSEYPKKADKKNSIKSITRLLEKPPKELQPDPVSILKKCVSNYKTYTEQEGTEKRYIIQSNNFFGEAERYKEFLHYEKPTQDLRGYHKEAIIEPFEKLTANEREIAKKELKKMSHAIGKGKIKMGPS